MARIFVSYKRDDLKKVKPLIDEIERRTGEKCWYDLDGIETSVQFASVICSAIDSADIVLFLHSRNHLGIDFQNDWTVRELTYAHESKKRVVLIKLDNTPLRNIFQMFYGGTNNIKINDPIQKEKLFRDLNSWLKKEEEELKPVPPQPPFHRRKWFWPAISGVFATFVIIAGVLLGGGSDPTGPEPEKPETTDISTPTTPAVPEEQEDQGKKEQEPKAIAVKNFSLNSENITLTIGVSKKIEVFFIPPNATDKSVVWQSTHPDVASVSSEGLVTANTAGSTTIIASAGGKVQHCNVRVKEKESKIDNTNVINGHEWVDLGLSVKWATCNVGARRPEEFGEYYAWGETDTKESYTSENYKWFDISKKTRFNDYLLTKYNSDSKEGLVDNKSMLDAIDDVATVKWGKEWRIPTYNEWNELRNKCSWEWKKIGDVYGYKVSSKVNNSYIFLPAAGEERVSSGVGHYWASTISFYNDCANSIDFDAKSKRIDYYVGHRQNGYSVRPILVPESIVLQ